MSFWHPLYEVPARLTEEWGHHRIFAPESYPAIRAVDTVPITFSEGGSLARHVPLCWRRDDDRLRLVALLGLRPDCRRVLPYEELPLAIRGYPFVVPNNDTISRREIWVDRAIADKPTDMGAPLVLDDGKLSKAAQMRAQNVLQLAYEAAATEALGDELTEAGLLEPWPLEFDLGGGKKFRRSDLFVLSAARLSDPAFFGLIERHGASAGLLLGYHRASLFRINWLLADARAAASRAALPEGRGDVR
ncbi:MAG: SapC family protein [Proteobacteria bacterium]|nr:SapC family protein [Pseudomonadota bacterium]